MFYQVYAKVLGKNPLNNKDRCKLVAVVSNWKKCNWFNETEARLKGITDPKADWDYWGEYTQADVKTLADKGYISENVSNAEKVEVVELEWIE